jgi:hypothetical protein
MNFNNDEEAIDFFNRLLERLHQADMVNHGSKIELVYVAPGAQHVETQYISLTPDPSPSRKASPRPIPAYAPTRSLSPVGRGDLKGEIAEDSFKADTPLSALFRENHHEEVRKVIESWRPYLIGNDQSVDALAMIRFEFDKDRIYSNKVYRDLCELDALGALQVPLSQLAHYLADHSNLSRSYATLYQQLKNYRSEYVAYSP